VLNGDVSPLLGKVGLIYLLLSLILFDVRLE